MFMKDWQLAWRNIGRRKGYTTINAAGLALGLACAMVAFLFIQDELSFDRFHEKSNRIYRLTADLQLDIGVRGYSLISSDFLPVFREAVPELEDGFRLKECPAVLRLAGRVYKTKTYLADPEIFQVLSLALPGGSPATALATPDSLVLSQSAARRMFGESEARGRTVSIQGHPFRVTAIMKDLPGNSHFQPEALLPFSAGRKLFWPGESFTLTATYVLLKPRTAEATALAQLRETLIRHWPKWGKRHVLKMQPLTDIHLGSAQFGEFSPNGRLAYLYFAALLAVLILLQGGINYVNLQTALFMRRRGEAGIRKVLGASPLRVTRQFLVESVLITFLAALAALALSQMLLLFIRQLFHRTLDFNFAGNAWLYLFLLVLVLSVGILAGLYPAWQGAGRAPVREMQSGRNRQRNRFTLRRLLVVAQFGLSASFLLITLTVFWQYQHVRAVQTGMNCENTLSVSLSPEFSERFLHTIRQHSEIVETCRTTWQPGNDVSWPREVSLAGQPETEKWVLPVVETDADFVEFYRLILQEGRSFRGAGGNTRSSLALVNESAARLMGKSGITGRSLQISYMENPCEIAGVLKDFQFESFRKATGPIVFVLNPGACSTVAIRYPEGLGASTGHLIKRELDLLFQDTDQSYEILFQDEMLEKVYLPDKLLGQLLAASSLLAVFIALLGMLGLTALTVETRLREVGIRKALGASLLNLSSLLCREFFWLAGLANLLAWPLSYWLMQRWLTQFSLRIEPGPGLFLLVGTITLGLALPVMLGQVLRAARANPADVLRQD